MNNFALYGYNEKLIKTVCRLLDFQTAVNDEPSLNKGSMRLVKLDTPENLRERVRGSKISKDKIRNMVTSESPS